MKRKYQIRVYRKDGSNFVDHFENKRDATEMVAAINSRGKETGLKARLEMAFK